MCFFIFLSLIFVSTLQQPAWVEASDSQKKGVMKSEKKLTKVAKKLSISDEFKFPADWRNFHKPSRKKLESMLSPETIEVTQENDTEPPFRNRYWDNKAEGIYVDIISGEPLFSSTTKYKSGTGWPSFYQPIDSKHIKLTTDYELGYPRNEVRSNITNSHLGHVFDDGPKPTGKRYCINSAAMKFIPKEFMEKLGYGEYLKLFNRTKQ